LDFWESRIDGAARGPDGSVLLSDFEGLGHEIVVTTTGDEPLSARHPEIPEEHALQGFEGVRAFHYEPSQSEPLLERLLGARPAGESVWDLRGSRRGSFVAYDAPPADRPLPGAGTVHHVAWGTTVAEHPRWEERLSSAGVPTSGIIDRHYFHSIYFREPSGVLFEIADDGPGFTVDVPLEELGSKVILPPRLEPQRAEIEALLTPLPDPRADWAAQR
jgi:glyoxalase family protein